MEQQSLVVLGAGFGGLRAALSLERSLRRARLSQRYRVVLVDRQKYHTYTPLLTETATAFEETFRGRKEAAAVGIEEILRGTRILFINDSVTDVDPSKRMVAFLHHAPIVYATVVVALGGETNYFDIPGIEENAMPLKTFADSQLFAMRLHACVNEGKGMRVVVGGGGPTGVELAGGLAAFGWQVRKTVPHFKTDITLIEGQPSILPGFLPKVISRTSAMLQRQGVALATGSRITRADASTIRLENGTAIPYDVLAWTGGVQASKIATQLSAQIDHGRLAVDSGMACLSETPTLTLEQYVYAIGDIVCFHDPRTGATVPWIARAALEQADVVGRNVVERLKAQHLPGYIPHLRNYLPRTYPYIIPVGRRDAIAHIGNFTLGGEPARLLKWFVELNYLTKILPLGRALRMWWKGGRMTV